MFYEVDMVTFAASKRLNALLKYIKKGFPDAKKDQPIYFQFKPESKCIQLMFDAPHKYSTDGWMIQPHFEPCKLYQRDIDNFGTKEYPIPPSCLTSVYTTGIPNTVPVLHYGEAIST